MIEKMNFLSITGPKADIDRVVNTYLCKYEIHLENALSELTTVESLTPFLDVNPYRDALNSINTIYEELKTPPSTSNKSPGIETALSTVKEIRSQADQLQKEQSELEEKCSSLEESLRIIRPFRNIDYDISSILHLKYIHFHFGRIEKQYYEKFKKYIYDNLNTIFLKCDEDDQYVWGVYFVPKHDQNHQPPTKLKNQKLFKPFEMYVKMYGLPAYGEMDPTWFVAITYSFIFGAMFGDAGQGLLLFIGGLLLYKLKHIDLAGIISCAGVFSTFFGLMFGSVFGFEDLIPALWLRPVDSMTTIPFIGKLNTVFIVAIGFGMGIILLCMVFNIINSFKMHDVEKTWFDTNAVAGLVFYGSAVLCIGLFVSGHAVPGGAVLAIMFGLPLLLIFFKEPLTNLVEKKAEVMPKEKGMFIVQGIFELFEVILSYFSNTLSFVRIGAFAVSHAAMMEVVLMLAGAENGSPNWIVIILGNLFVCAMEGLIVGIQVLRLEYYEMFSRFYKGSGRKFEPFCSKNK